MAKPLSCSSTSRPARSSRARNTRAWRGVIWPLGIAGAFGLESGWVNIGWDKIWAWFMAPFLIGDAVKAVLAALIVTGGWAALTNRLG